MKTITLMRWFIEVGRFMHLTINLVEAGSEGKKSEILQSGRFMLVGATGFEPATT